MNMNYATVSVLTTNTIIFSIEISLFDTRKGFQISGINIYFDKITVQLDTYPKLSHENRNYTLSYVRVDKFDEQ